MKSLSGRRADLRTSVGSSGAAITFDLDDGKSTAPNHSHPPFPQSQHPAASHRANSRGTHRGQSTTQGPVRRCIDSFVPMDYDGSSQKAKQKRLISAISLFSLLSRPKEAALGFVGTALCVCFISGVFPCILKNNNSHCYCTSSLDTDLTRNTRAPHLTPQH